MKRAIRVRRRLVILTASHFRLDGDSAATGDRASGGLKERSLRQYYASLGRFSRKNGRCVDGPNGIDVGSRPLTVI